MIKLSSVSRPVSQENLEKAGCAFDQLMRRSDLGFFKLPERGELWKKSAERAEQLRASYSSLAVVGMGGSSLGVRALDEWFQFESNGKELLFFDNVDGYHFPKKLASLDKLESVHWVLISKSGSTIETIAMADFIAQHLKDHGLELANKCTIVSETKSSLLADWGRSNDIPILEIPEDVGGRFSVLTPVGVLPASFIGQDVEELRKGAQWTCQQKSLVCDLAGLSLDSWDRQEWISLFWTYSDRMRWFGDWVQQLWAESLAKKNDRQGRPAARVSTPMALVGTCDQHSVLQQVADGYKDKFVFFFRSQQSEQGGSELKTSVFSPPGLLSGRPLSNLFRAQAQATAQGLTEVGVSSLSIEVESYGAKQLGALFMLLELTVGTLGEALDVNAFDQPGVELGKRLAKQILMQEN